MRDSTENPSGGGTPNPERDKNQQFKDEYYRSWHEKVKDFNKITSLRELLASCHQPPYLRSHEMHDLDFHNAGISAIREALLVKPFKDMAPRMLSRYASHIAPKRLSTSATVAELKTIKPVFENTIKNLQQPDRIYYHRIVDAAGYSYKPNNEAPNIRVWMWDEDDRTELEGTLSDAMMPKKAFFIFVADALLDLSEKLGEITQDLKFERDYGMKSLRYLLFTIKFAISEAEEDQEIGQ